MTSALSDAERWLPSTAPALPWGRCPLCGTKTVVLGSAAASEVSGQGATIDDASARDETSLGRRGASAPWPLQRRSLLAVEGRASVGRI